MHKFCSLQYYDGIIIITTTTVIVAIKMILKMIIGLMMISLMQTNVLN